MSVVAQAVNDLPTQLLSGVGRPGDHLGVIMAVRRAHPHLVWENCEDGGCMMTYRMARLCHTSITVDNIAAYATRQGVYGASSFLGALQCALHGG